MTTLAVRLAAAGLDWIVPSWAAPVGALCTTRNGAPGAGEPLDVGPARLDALDSATRARVLGHRRAVHAFLPSTPVYLEQVHGRDVAAIDPGNVAAARAKPPVADAAVTRLAGVPLAVRVADCVPVLLASRTGEAIAAAHAGWRGLAAGVIEATLAAMRTPAADVAVWLGPAIGPDAFEVGDEVCEAFAAADERDAAHFRRQRDGKWLADLHALARARLARAGVRHVAADPSCTFAEPARFHSWRRHRTPSRFAAYIWREGPAAPVL